ncbi:MAG: response regulator, partial [Pseudomonadota bacterium]
ADLEEAYPHAHTLKGAARAVDIPAVEAIAHRLETMLQAVWDGATALDPPAAAIAGRALDAAEDISAAVLAGEGERPAHEVLKQLDGLLTARGLEAPPPPPAHGRASDTAGPAAATVRVEAEVADRLTRTVAGLIQGLAFHRHLLADLGRLRAEVRALRRECREARHADRHGAAAALTRVCAHADRLAHGHDAAAGRLAELDWTLERLVDDIAGDVQHLRMVSAGSQFGGYARVVREAAAAQGKEVAVELAGMEVRADREVLQILSEPVLHLLRNAVSHGIEPPAQRAAAGKPPLGEVRLEAGVVAGRLAVTVADDGRGIDPRALARRAVERGLLSPETAARADEVQLRQLAFEPGLSTSGAVTAFAGRGMGMSIVRKVVGRLHGSVALDGREGGGTVVTLTVPVAIAAERLLLLEVRHQTFALPGSAVERVGAAAVPDDLVTVDGMPMAAIGTEERVPLADLGLVLGLPPPEAPPPALVVAVLRADGVGLVADALGGVVDLPVEALDPPLADDPLLAGSAMLPDGRLVLVLSAPALASAAIGGRGVPSGPSEARPPPLVLVVDDSITTRMLEKSILESHGYRVALAVDGRQALDMLAGQRPDVVVSDIEMPNLDGFGLLAVIKRSPTLRDIPVVLVTSRATEADRERGLKLGAAAYIVKTRFDQDDLLEAIGRLT